MARIEPVDPAVEPALADIYGHIERTRGQVSDILKSLGNAPEGLKRFAALGEYIRFQSALPARTRELAILTIARGIHYAWMHHVGPALRAGVTQAELDTYRDGTVPDTLDAGERAAIAYAAEFTQGGQVAGPTFELASAALSKREITDLTLLCGYFIALGFTVNAFQVGLEPGYVPR